MALPSGIKRGGNTYSARYVLPRPEQRLAGRHDLVQAMGTDSLTDAVELAAPIIAGWKAWAVAVGKGDLRHEPEVYVRSAEVAHRLIRNGIDQWSPELIVERAREVFAMQQAGRIAAYVVEAQVDLDVETSCSSKMQVHRSISRA